ncbi:hypothetical protein SSX86_032583 [Deinandra increscens subsp. villosa]|uniref:DUF4005 domain-containing protein n=1 Tax=Deinandra increscens subsp. villosa TaxID=3103831 RepID=A0AAP0C4S1_9ASTR
MGKTSRFFKALFGFKSPDQSNDVVDKQIKRRWSFFKSHRDKPHPHLHDTFDASLTRPRHTPRHHLSSDQTAAAATTAVAAVGEDDYGLPGEWAAVKIQAYFRSHLARKALRALKSLVKLQALVRGHIQRKQAGDELRRWQALVRVQARARACRFQITESPQSTTNVKGPQTPEKFEHIQRSRAVKHSHSSILKSNSSKRYDEIDTAKSHVRRGNLFQLDHVGYGPSQSQSFTTSRGSTVHQLGLSPSGSYEVTSLTAPLKYFGHDIEEHVSFSTTQNSPSFYAISSKNGSMRVSPFTPAKSDSSRSCLSGSSDHPNYMAYTESSRAKVRSVSAPRQRHNLEFPSNTKRYSVYGYGSSAQRGSNLHDSFVSKAYPGSGRLDRLGMPVGGGFRESEFSGGYWN